MLCYFKAPENYEAICAEVGVATYVDGYIVMPADCISMLYSYVPTNVQIIDLTKPRPIGVHELDSLVTQADLRAEECDIGYAILFEQYKKLFGDNYPALLHVLKHHYCPSMKEFLECL